MRHEDGGGRRGRRGQCGPEGRFGGRGKHHGGRLRRRPLDYGEMRLLLLALIGEGPRHGYELIKAVEEMFGGSYAPSPGVVYPTLAWLDDMGFAAAEEEPGGRKSYRLTGAGEAFLKEQAAAVAGLQARINAGSAPGRPDVPSPILRAMENLKLALRLRMQEGQIEPEAAARIAAAIDTAAQAVEQER